MAADHNLPRGYDRLLRKSEEIRVLAPTNCTAAGSFLQLGWADGGVAMPGKGRGVEGEVLGRARRGRCDASAHAELVRHHLPGTETTS